MARVGKGKNVDVTSSARFCAINTSALYHLPVYLAKVI